MSDWQAGSKFDAVPVRGRVAAHGSDGGLACCPTPACVLRRDIAVSHTADNSAVCFVFKWTRMCAARSLSRDSRIDV